MDYGQRGVVAHFSELGCIAVIFHSLCLYGKVALIKDSF